MSKQSKYTILLAIAAFFLCLPILFWDNSIVRDVAARYTPMVEAFARGDWQNAFHPRIPPLFIVIAGLVSRLFCLGGTVACEISSALFFALTVFPFMALMKKVFNQKYAMWATVMLIICSRLLRIAGMGVRDTAKCFFLVLAAYGLVCFFRKYNWKGAVYCSLGCIGLALTRGDSLLFALLFLASIALIELFKQKCFPYKSLCAVLMFLIFTAPWAYYEYQHTDWPVMESRHATILNKIFKTAPSNNSLAVANITSRKALANPARKAKISNKSNKEFFENLWKGFYPQYIFFIIPVLFFRIRRKILKPEELILLLIVLLHAAGMIAQIAIADKQLFIYKRYLIVATPLLFGWAAIGLRWLVDKIKRILTLKYRWFAKAVIIVLITLSVFDAWSRVRKTQINPFFYKTFEQYIGIDIRR